MCRWNAAAQSPLRAATLRVRRPTTAKVVRFFGAAPMSACSFVPLAAGVRQGLARTSDSLILSDTVRNKDSGLRATAQSCASPDTVSTYAAGSTLKIAARAGVHAKEQRKAPVRLAARTRNT
ncbi:MAG: hypothetical protein Q3Y08_00685 [Butyricicoccus sp.]|nr:hypothetical protein [Butyricicoccus sp.]